ncbi:MAG TPA: ATP-binding protein [Sedimentisphaerales bacterium]|nr:ATP-binding protein [Sedimentisphaerales bacterium]
MLVSLEVRLQEAAQFRELRTLEDFDWQFNPSIQQKLVYDLATGRFIRETRDCLWLRPPGVGKTHLAIALGLAACRTGRRVRFYTAAALVTRLEETQKQYQLDRLLRQLDRVDLLICDELGYLSFSRTGAELLFQVFADRYERGELPVPRVRQEEQTRGAGFILRTGLRTAAKPTVGIPEFLPQSGFDVAAEVEDSLSTLS